MLDALIDRKNGHVSGAAEAAVAEQALEIRQDTHISGGNSPAAIDAVGIELAHPVTHRDALRFVQRLGSGKQRSGVAFVAHPEKHEVEARKLALSYLTPSCFTLAYFTVRHFKR